MSDNQSSNKRPLTKTLGYSTILVLLFITGVYYKEQLLPFYQQVMSVVKDGKSDQLVTYYQWTDSQGQIQISRNKPDDAQAVTSFTASADLMLNQNNVDSGLIQQSQNYQAAETKGVKSQSKTRNSNTTTSIYPFSAIEKTRRCTQLSQQIASAKNNQRDSEALKKEYAKTCG